MARHGMGAPKTRLPGNRPLDAFFTLGQRFHLVDGLAGRKLGRDVLLVDLESLCKFGDRNYWADTHLFSQAQIGDRRFFVAVLLVRRCGNRPSGRSDLRSVGIRQVDLRARLLIDEQCDGSAIQQRWEGAPGALVDQRRLSPLKLVLATAKGAFFGGWRRSQQSAAG
jgi:hypothetical protein